MKIVSHQVMLNFVLEPGEQQYRLAWRSSDSTDR